MVQVDLTSSGTAPLTSGAPPFDGRTELKADRFDEGHTYA
jgi:hypothetical protein